MDTVYEKKDEQTLVVSKTAEVTTETNEYTLEFLLQQELSILKQRNKYIEARDKELAEVRELIAQAKLLGIVSDLEVEKAKKEVLN